ncbi:glycosyltransferase family 2 protein [bacterium]|nr:glycosyltransferase family 2 protein [bacterium]
MPKIYAIILTLNNYSDTCDCIKSLIKSQFPLTSIVVVDNHSTDGSIQKLQKDFYLEDRVHFILNKNNLGFAKGANIGIHFSLKQGASYIFLINNDAIVDPLCTELLLKELNKNPSNGMAGPRIFYHKEPNKIWHSGGYFNRLKTGVIIPEKNKLNNEVDDKIIKVSFLTGCCMLIKREAFEKVGFFDESYFMYEEDVDFCFRTIKKGFNILYVPKAHVWHKISSTLKERTSSFVFYNMSRSRLIFLRKNFSFFYFLYACLIHFLIYTPYRIIQACRRQEKTWQSILAWMKGTKDGLTIALRFSKE